MIVLIYQCRACHANFERSSDLTFEYWNRWLAKTLNSTIRFHECEFTPQPENKIYGLSDLIAIEERKEKP